MSLASAFRGESFRLTSHRKAVIFGFWLPPLLWLLFTIAVGLIMRRMMPDLPGLSMPVSQTINALGAASNPILQLFWIMGAAGLFANDYRWETWRLIAPRNSRTDLMLGKFATFMAFGTASVLLLGLAGFVLSFEGALFRGGEIVWPSAGKTILGLAIALLVSLLELAVVGALTALVVVVTRSGVAALMVVFLFCIGQSSGEMFLPSIEDKIWPVLLPKPDGNIVREGLMSLAAGKGAEWPVFAALAFLVLATPVLLALTIWLFRRQDLSRE